MDAYPSSLGRILIVGAGGFGREVFQWARDAWPDRSHLLAGFLSSDPDASASKLPGLPILGDPAAFSPQLGDRFLLGIGIPLVRRQVSETLLARGARFLTLIHPTALVSRTASIGEGSILCPYSIVTDSARVGRFTLLNYHSSVAHDASTGDYAVLSPYAAIGGGASIGEDVFLGLHASVGPRIGVGPRSKVAANSCALHDAPAETLIHGVPGRSSPLLSR